MSPRGGSGRAAPGPPPGPLRPPGPWTPRAGTDGTYPESANDVLVRVRQLLSITETQYTGADILVISPDSDNLSVLQAAALGYDLRAHPDFAFKPGDARELMLAESKPEQFSGSLACPNPPACK